MSRLERKAALLCIALVASVASAQTLPRSGGGSGSGNCATCVHLTGNEEIDGEKTFLQAGKFSASLVVGSGAATATYRLTLRNSGAGGRGLHIAVDANQAAIRMEDTTGIVWDGATGFATSAYRSDEGRFIFSRSLRLQQGTFLSDTFAPTAPGITSLWFVVPGGVGTWVHKITLAPSYWTCSAATQSSIIATLPARSRVVGVYAHTSQTYDGTAPVDVGTLRMKVGSTSGGDEYLLEHDVRTATIQRGHLAAHLGAGLQVLGDAQMGGALSWSTQDVYATLTASAGNMGNGTCDGVGGSFLFQGITTFWVLYQVLP